MKPGIYMDLLHMIYMSTSGYISLVVLDVLVLQSEHWNQLAPQTIDN